MADDDSGVLNYSPARATLHTRVADRLAKVETKLGEGMPPRQVAKWVRDTYGLGRRQADKYVASVMRRWAADAEKEAPAERRQRVRAMLQTALAACYSAKKPMVVPVGGGCGEIQYGNEPDLKTAAKLIETVMKFEGLGTPDINISGTNVQVNLMAELQKHYGLEPEGETDGE